MINIFLVWNWKKKQLEKAIHCWYLYNIDVFRSETCDLVEGREQEGNVVCSLYDLWGMDGAWHNIKCSGNDAC